VATSLDDELSAATRELAAWERPDADLRRLPDVELREAQVRFAALRERLAPLVLDAEAMIPEQLDLIARASSALRRAVYGEALVMHHLRMRRVSPGVAGGLAER
jgi:hypothetical protein